MACCQWHLSKNYQMSKTKWTRWPHSQLLQHALMKSPRQAELPCTRAHSACISVWTSVDRHWYPVANCFLLTLVSYPSASFLHFHGLCLWVVRCLHVFACFCVFIHGHCLCCICLLLFLPAVGPFIRLTTIIKPVRFSLWVKRCTPTFPIVIFLTSLSSVFCFVSTDSSQLLLCI